MTKLRWRYGIIAAIFLAVFASYPQLKMWHAQGTDWNGHYAYNDIDEVAYAAYLKALIDGRSRKNDPYTGRDDSDENPQTESLFSIQFASPYLVAIPARIFGISAPTAMTLAGVLAGFLTALACFWLIGLITQDSLFAMSGSLLVLCGGALAAGEGAIGEILGHGVSYPYFPFLRRYVPAVPFPVFFLFLTSVWFLIKSVELKSRLLWIVLAFSSFTFLVFSYFYIWTTAAAWLACLALLWLVIRPKKWLDGFATVCILGGSLLIPLGIYAFMLSQRSVTMDHVQLLVFTRQTDFFRFPEYISFFVLGSLVILRLLKIIGLKSPSVIFTISFALVPVIVFNQQVITGRSLQPIHYQVFIGNYVAALSLVAFIGLFWSRIKRESVAVANFLAITISIVAIIWGFVECHYTVRVLDQANIIRDKGIPVAKAFVEAGSEDQVSDKTVLAIGNILADDLPTIAPQNVLWSRHQHVFAGLTWQENKERYYQYLYYQNLDSKWLKRRLKKGDFVSMIALFGWGRHTNRLSFQAKPLTNTEIENEAANYRSFWDSFDPAMNSMPKLSFLAVSVDQKPDLTNVDKWYERGEHEQLGIYRLYRLKMRSAVIEKEKRPSR